VAVVGGLRVVDNDPGQPGRRRDAKQVDDASEPQRGRGTEQLVKPRGWHHTGHAGNCRQDREPRVLVDQLVFIVDRRGNGGGFGDRVGLSEHKPHECDREEPCGVEIAHEQQHQQGADQQ